MRQKARQFTSGHQGDRASNFSFSLSHPQRDPSCSVMFDIKDQGHFARRWLREVMRIRNRGVQSRALISVYGRKISFFCGLMNSRITGTTDKRWPLFLDTHDFAMLHSRF